MESKAEIRSKPILSPTRSLDEGFESDPDRISTDSEHGTAQTAPAFDVLQRTDRDGVQHTQIARRTQDGGPLAKDSGPESILCLDGEIENELRSKLEKTTLGRPPTGLQPQKQNSNNQQASQQIRYRRIKTRAPPPPLGSYYYQKRSQSVDSMNRANLHHANPYEPPGGGMSPHLVDMVNSHGDVLAGRFVRVSVDPRHQAPPQHQSLQHQPLQNHPYRHSSLSTNNIYKYCHASTPMTHHHQMHHSMHHNHHGHQHHHHHHHSTQQRNANLYSLPYGGLSADPDPTMIHVLDAVDTKANKTVSSAAAQRLPRAGNGLIVWVFEARSCRRSVRGLKLLANMARLAQDILRWSVPLDAVRARRCYS
ncbi:hypothetical protein pipiens_008516 [Culex pipiens pipiens]|uniref:Uncharacterized protein n=1 Tax=Culex pipiens pipiens TaxID=38569 RepID=A0ABD1DKW3_CULPP